MKILFVIKALAAGPGGGAQRVLAAISTSLAARGHRFLCLRLISQERRTSIPSGRKCTEFTVRELDYPPLVRARWSCSLGYGSSVNYKRTAPDVALGFMHSSFVPLGFALLGTRCAGVACERIAYNYYRGRLVEKLAVRLSARLFDTITINSDAALSSFPAAIADRMIVIPNPVGNVLARADPVGGAQKILLMVGGLRPQKDHVTLIEAFEIVPDHCDWQFRIVGEDKCVLLWKRRCAARSTGPS